MNNNSANQLGVLLKKDWLILRRNWVFLLMFIVLPVLMMTAFWQLHAIVGSTDNEEHHNLQRN